MATSRKRGTRGSRRSGSLSASPAPELPLRDNGGSLLAALGIRGWGHLEPIVVAALATESPLLLIGPHGSAKSLLLTRLAAALGLEQRHYNASLLNFDDLVGFPVPEHGKLVYLQTPATVWDAEVVFFDEVSRCRPDLQNKLFPIIHERMVQGVPLDRLRHRWAAMNPPPNPEGDGSDCEYIGAEPLDIALADRFAFIVEVPTLAELSRTDRLAVLSMNSSTSAGADGRLRAVLDDTRAALPRFEVELERSACEYVSLFAQNLAAAGHPLSTRRAVQLVRNIAAVAAALLALGIDAAPEDAFYCAARHSLPDAAWGRRPPTSLVLCAHRAAWEVARLEDGVLLKAVLTEPDPVRRIALALDERMPPAEAGEVVSDAFSLLPRPARLATASLLLPRLLAAPHVPIHTLEAVAHDYAIVAKDGEEVVTVRQGGQDWKREILSTRLAELNPGTARGRALVNVAIALLVDDERFSLDDLARAYDHAREVLEVETAGAA